MKKSMSYLLLSVALAFGAMAAHADHQRGAETEKPEMKAEASNDALIDGTEKKTTREKRKAHRSSCKRR